MVSALNRGGLFHVSKDVQQIFVITEKYFLRKTGGKPNPSVKINKLILDIVGFSYIQDLFTKIVNKVDLDTHLSKFKEVAKDTLFSMIQLYIRVRMFSLVKDYVQHQRLLKSAKGKEKSLRKSLKKKKEAKVYIHALV